MTVLYRSKVLWITRSAPFGLAIARKCGSEGLPALAVPVLQVSPLPVSRPNHVPDAILFTSAQGVRLHSYDPRWKDVAVLTVGDGTAEQALAKGYTDVRSAVGDVEDLKALIAQTLPRRARIFLFGARDAAGDLDAFLRLSRYDVEQYIVYETRGSTDGELRNAIDLLDRIDGICVYSPKDAERVSQLLGNRRWGGTIFCLSQACAARIEPRDGLKVEVADRPSESALRQLVRCRWLIIRSEACADAARAPSLALRNFRSELRQGVANDNPNASSRPFARAPEPGDDEPPPTAA